MFCVTENKKSLRELLIEVLLILLFIGVGSTVVKGAPPVASEAAMAMEALGLLDQQYELTNEDLEIAWVKANKKRADTDVHLPFVRLSSFKTKDYSHLLAGYSTPLRPKEVGRNHNIKIAAFYLNQLVIPPGEIFSFNNVVGKRSIDNGFVYANQLYMGQSVKGVGGGVCQVATTLFNAALLTGFTVLEHTPHSQTVYYISPGRDATVADEGIDLLLRNDSGQEVLLITNVVEDRLNISFYGKVDMEVKYHLEVRELGEVPITFIQNTEANIEWTHIEKGLRVQLWRVSSLGFREYIAQADYAIRVFGESPLF